MGEVYRARDTKLDRPVAIKILPAVFVSDPERIARFQREAKTLASLNHPNIGAIYGIEESNGTTALVLELVEGPTLADHIAQAPIPLDEALPIARQIAEDLAAAHEQGIIHRDLKPANIKVRPDGTVKVLDFGLAKALESEVTAGDMSHSPTLTAAGTRLSVIVGTAAYMPRNERRVRNIYWQRVDGTGDVQRLTMSQNSQSPDSFHPTGKYLAFGEATADTRDDLMILPLEGDEAAGWKPGQPTVFLRTPAREIEAAFSPDGNWLAYVSDESKQQEVYVRPFPGPGGAWQVSNGGGNSPSWSAGHRELVYRAPDNRLMAASYVSRGDSFRTDRPRLWSDRAVVGQFALHPDGDRIALEAASIQKTPTTPEKLVVITHFFDELRRLTPTGR